MIKVEVSTPRTKTVDYNWIFFFDDKGIFQRGWWGLDGQPSPYLDHKLLKEYNAALAVATTKIRGELYPKPSIHFPSFGSCKDKEPSSGQTKGQTSGLSSVNNNG